jgi:single-strand DNA-binding protein
MAGVNKVILLGNLGKDPEVRVFDSGTKKASFPLATSETYMDKSGQRQERVEWHNVIFWGKIAEVIEKYLKKGSQIYVEGRIATRSYDDKDGVKRYITEIEGQTMTMVGGRPNSESSPAAPYSSDSSSMTNSRPASTESVNTSIMTDVSDDLPF